MAEREPITAPELEQGCDCVDNSPVPAINVKPSCPEPVCGAVIRCGEKCRRTVMIPKLESKRVCFDFTSCQTCEPCDVFGAEIVQSGTASVDPANGSVSMSDQKFLKGKHFIMVTATAASTEGDVFKLKTAATLKDGTTRAITVNVSIGKEA